ETRNTKYTTMNHKELIAKIALKMNLPKQDIENLLAATIETCTEQLRDGKTIGVQSFGSLEVRKKEERLSVHPATQIRTLIPPKLVVNFKQSLILKDKLKDLTHHE
ncbi:MAG: HU family DNA-binding protein, partial [Paludibacter sp.]|nr:HU family DNA-binding protein [Paludibacter sp.]